MLNSAVVLSQECDLHQDLQNRVSSTRSTQDKFLHSVLLAPAYLVDNFREGRHLTDLGVTCERVNSKVWQAIRQNNVDRYHFLPASAAFDVPELILDFKHFVTVPRNVLLELKPQAYVASLGQLFRDRLSQRFANYLARIALPDPADEAQVTQAEAVH